MIELNQVRRTFQVGNQRVNALRDIELSIEAGEYISVMGPSGSGKSSLLNVIGLLDRPDSGRYRLDGVEMTAQSDSALAAARCHKIGFVFQSFHLIPRLSAAENIELPLVLAGVKPSVRQRQVADALASLGISARGQHRPDQLSGGERQRVAIARAMIARPQVLLADEPTGNLDRTSGSEVITTLERLNRQGLTLIVVTHDPDLGRRAPRRLRMVDGRIDVDQQQLAEHRAHA